MNAPLATVEADRSKFIGGSDIAAVLGVSPWKSPYELWEEKTHRKPKEVPSPEQQKRFDRGHRLEPVVVDMLLDRLQAEGLQVELLARNERYVDPEHAFMGCEIDFELRVTGEVEIDGQVRWLDGEHINGDCKTVHPFAAKKWGDEGSDQVPIEYAAQFMFGLGITGRQLCICASLIGMDDLLIYWVERDQETIDGIRNRVHQFWTECVIAGVEPDPIDFDDCKEIYKKANGSSIEATTEVRDAVYRLAEVKSKLKSLEEQEEALQFQITDFMRPHAFLTAGGHEIASWKNQDHTSLAQKDMKEQEPEMYARFKRVKEIRVLRLKKVQ